MGQKEQNTKPLLPLIPQKRTERREKNKGRDLSHLSRSSYFHHTAGKGRAKEEKTGRKTQIHRNALRYN